MFDLWNKAKEQQFFSEASKFATPEQLFYKTEEARYFAYWPKGYKGRKSTLQSRNSLIGKFTEVFSVEILQHFAKSQGLYAVQNVICEELGLTSKSPADVAICVHNRDTQCAEDIKAIFEVKMSIVWNWEFKNNTYLCLGDYRTHSGNPGLLRSDSVLKAIGKSINIRVSNIQASNIPIIILGNTPITDSYTSKVDILKNAGIIQGFWSVNPKPLDNDHNNIKQTPKNGFIRMDSCDELLMNLKSLFAEKQEFFSSMKSKMELGKLIEIANKEDTYEKKAEKFLSLIRR